jgi:hypothetical protein
MRERPEPRTVKPSVTGYRVVLPPGWQRIPARQGTNAAIRDILDMNFGALPHELPRDKLFTYRKDLERRLISMISQARQKGALDVYLPVAPRGEIHVPASFLVSEGSLGAVSPVDPALITTYLAAADDKHKPVTIDGADGVRIDHTAPPEPARDIDYGSRRVDYIVPVPGDADRWLVIAFSTIGGGDPKDEFAGLLVELFDAIMATFRWTRA